MNSIRTLIKAPGFTIAALLSITIGIGATSAIFGVANALLLRPLPYPHAERLAMLWQRSPGLGVPRDWPSLGQYLDIKAENTVFDRVAAAIGASFNLTRNGTPEHVDGVRMSSALLPMLGAHAVLGVIDSPMGGGHSRLWGEPTSLREVLQAVVLLSHSHLVN